MPASAGQLCCCIVHKKASAGVTGKEWLQDALCWLKIDMWTPSYNE